MRNGKAAGKTELAKLFEKCVNGVYRHVENAGDYFTERLGGTLYIYLECSNGEEDWENNLDFPARPYRHGDSAPWFAHRGFVRVWESVLPYLQAAIADPTVRNIVTVGYSHGAALAVLCHEYVWDTRRDLRERTEGYGFGCPRVYWGVRLPWLMRRWERFVVIRNRDDVVTHLPPAALGYSHVGKMLEIGSAGKYSPVDAHRPENILAELKLLS